MADPTTFDPTQYTIIIRRVNIEGEVLFRASVAELPDVADFAETQAEAYQLVLDTIAALYSRAEEDGEAFPAPLPEEDEYSGRVTLRLPKSLHRRVALAAKAEDVSLNSYLVYGIAEMVGKAQALPRSWAAVRWMGGVEAPANFFGEVPMWAGDKASRPVNVATRTPTLVSSGSTSSVLAFPINRNAA